MQFSSIGSGSRGNGTLVRHGSSLILIDCGFSLKETLQRLTTRGLSANDLSAIFVTHEHGDHLSGVGVLAKRFDIPVYLSAGTRFVSKLSRVPRVEVVRDGESVTIGEIEVLPVAVPHDAREPLQFLFKAGGASIGVLTDLGCITQHVVQNFSRCDALMLECNHDPYLLSTGPYPPSLKKRVAGAYGHLSNQQAADLLALLEVDRLRYLVVAHISEQNNSREHVLEQLLPRISEQKLFFAEQEKGFEWLSVEAD